MFQYKLYGLVVIINVIIAYGSRETEEIMNEEDSVSSDREMLDVGLFFTESTTVLTTTTEVYFNSNAPKGPLYNFIVTFSEPISISGVIDPKNPNGPVLILPGMKKPEGVRSEGIFERFLRNFLDLLSTTFSTRKLTRYCRILSRHLESMEFRHTRKLARHVKYLCKMDREDLKNEIVTYRQELDKKLPRRTECLNVMNGIFTLRDNQLFNDYIYELQNFGTEDKLFIDDETRKLLKDVIVGNILKISENDQKDLLKKLRRAITEYSEP